MNQQDIRLVSATIELLIDLLDRHEADPDFEEELEDEPELDEIDSPPTDSDHMPPKVIRRRRK